MLAKLQHSPDHLFGASFSLATQPPCSPRQNHLLAALPAAEFDRLAPSLELVLLSLDEVLGEPGRRTQYVYFPTSAILSLRSVMENGAASEVAGVGNEGILGVSAFMGGESTLAVASVQTEGYAYRMKATMLTAEFNRCGPVLRLMLRYSQALITQISQTTACNRHHSIEQQLCRWLLLTLDRSRSNHLVMTQEMIATMLGVRRESVTVAAGKLKQRGIIDYRRSQIAVLDRGRLETHVCECYEVVKSEFKRLLNADRNH